MGDGEFAHCIGTWQSMLLAGFFPFHLGDLGALYQQQVSPDLAGAGRTKSRMNDSSSLRRGHGSPARSNGQID